ncbi:MAG: UvrD-helicase domain-containing protein [Bacteroidota bacterium]|jgi:DNA helicase-2/ATP-dependent DNA helicase PcrA
MALTPSILAEAAQQIKARQAEVDYCIAEAAKKFSQSRSEKLSNFAYHLQKAQEESYLLSEGQDLCYDRITTPLVYSLWYQGRRINTLLSILQQLLTELPEKELTIFDLGAGTGALQIALGIWTSTLHKFRIHLPNIRIVNIDSSSLMLDYLEKFLWPAFNSKFPNNLTVEYCTNTWHDAALQSSGTSWIFASYLFDITDVKEEPERFDAACVNFTEILDKFKPAVTVVVNPQQKAELFKLLKPKIDQKYTVQVSGRKYAFFDGSLEATNSVRQELYEKYIGNSGSLHARSLRYGAQWQLEAMDVMFIRPAQTILELETEVPQDEKNEIAIYQLPAGNKTKVRFSPDQQKAATPDDSPTIITGPAGCGKTLVLIRRIVQLLKDNPDSEFKILLTTFNIDLIATISELLTKTCIENGVNAFISEYYPGNIPNDMQQSHKIYILHFDVLRSRIGGINTQFKYINHEKDYRNRALWDEAIKIIIKQKQLGSNQIPEFMNSDFFIEELHRVIYAKDIRNENAYQEVVRNARPYQLRKYRTNRSLIWAVYVQYLYLLQLQNKSTYLLLRWEFLRQLKAGKCNKLFTHIFIDEFQDCTNADHEIFFHLVQDPNQLLWAGDINQALQINRRVALRSIPRLIENMKRRVTHNLKGSYRLPLRIAECLMPLSPHTEKKEDDEPVHNQLIPVKNAPPGARPIIVFTNTIENAAQMIDSIITNYETYAGNKITVLEKDLEWINEKLANHFSPSLKIETNSILKYKGLEKQCTVWSTRIPLLYDGEIREFIYTTLTRSSGMLIIWISPETKKEYIPILKLLRKDRLIFWNEESENKFNKLVAEETVAIVDSGEQDDTGEEGE